MTAARGPAVSAAALLAAGAGLWAAVELPGRGTRAALTAETREAEVALSKAPARAHEVEMLLADLADARARLSAAGGLSEDHGPHATLARVAALAEGRGVSITRLAPGPPRARGTYREWPFAVSLEAPAPAVQAFLADLEGGRPLAEVTRLTLAPKPAGRDRRPGGPVRLAGEMAFTVYAAPAGS